MGFSKCDSSGCQSQSGHVTIDANWRWTHTTSGTQNCYTGAEWDATLCPDAATCTSNCVIEGADSEYTSTYGVQGSGNSLSLGFVTQGPYSRNVGSRTYLMDSDDSYMLFKLKNKEFTYTVDDSKLDCGLNGALYFVQMDADGGKGKYGNAGANDGTGKYGTCCTEIDIWEANQHSSAFTMHSCDTDGQTRCEGTDCGDNASGER